MSTLLRMLLGNCSASCRSVLAQSRRDGTVVYRVQVPFRFLICLAFLCLFALPKQMETGTGTKVQKRERHALSGRAFKKKRNECNVQLCCVMASELISYRRPQQPWRSDRQNPSGIIIAESRRWIFDSTMGKCRQSMLHLVRKHRAKKIPTVQYHTATPTTKSHPNRPR